METPHKSLIYDSGLYPRGFVIQYGESSPHWFKSNWYQRELSLRHDMVCVLLCNMQTTEKDIWETKEPPKKKRKVETEGSSSTSSATVDSLPEEEDLMVEQMGYWDNPDEFEQEIPAGEETNPENDMYRLVCLEGMSSAAFLQNQMCQRWGIKQYSTMFDIVDKDLCKLIEVKVTVSFERAHVDYLSKTEGRPDHTALFHINPHTMAIKWVGHPGQLWGESKVTMFLLKRRHIMTTNKIMESDLGEELKLEETIFCNPSFNRDVDEWVSCFWNLRNLKAPKNITKPSERNPLKITPKHMLEHLEDITTRDNPPILWGCKLLPPTWNEFIKTSSSRDSDMVREFVEKTQILEITPNSSLQTATKEFFSNFYNEKRSSFNAFNMANLKNSDELKSHLGINMKKYHTDDSCNTTVQPEPNLPEKACYHPWFDSLLLDMIQLHNLDGVPFHNLGEVTNTEHPIAIGAQKAFFEISNIFKSTWIGIYASKITNMGSRIGGAYLSRTRKSSHSNIVCFPLYSANTMDGEVTRYMSGVLIRAPHHATSLTDKIGIITIELVRKDDRTKEYLKYLKKAEIISTPSGHMIAIRVNSETKHNCTYSTFSANSLFITSNLIGEIILNRSGAAANMDFVEEISKFCKSNFYWVASRILEGVLMITIGGNQEEGFFSLLRKLFMSMLAWKRKELVGSWPVDEFCKSINETIINSPLAMHFYRSTFELLKMQAEEEE